MRRSRFITLLSMGTAAIALTACDDPADTAVFESVQQCIDSGMYDSNTCRSQYAQATQAHAQAAPLFTSAEECQAAFGPGNCQPAPEAQQAQAGSTGHSLFMPLMMGYMMGSLSRGGVGVPPQPLYRGWESGRSGAFRTADATVVSNTTGRASVNANSTAFRSSTVARGGFGARSFAGS